MPVFNDGQRSGRRLRGNTPKDKIISRGRFPAMAEVTKRSKRSKEGLKMPTGFDSCVPGTLGREGTKEQNPDGQWIRERIEHFKKRNWNLCSWGCRHLTPLPCIPTCWWSTLIMEGPPSRARVSFPPLPLSFWPVLEVHTNQVHELPQIAAQTRLLTRWTHSAPPLSLIGSRLPDLT